MRSYGRRFYNKVNTILDKHLVKLRKNSLNNVDFTIISNNCWGGAVYRRFGLPYLTPTVGLYFFPDDYLKFCSDVKGYMDKPLEFISFAESRHEEILVNRKQTHVPIGRLGDVEIVFLHYPTKEEAAEKWLRRANRINYDNLIFKFSKMNYCTDDHLYQFDQLAARKKICFLPSGCKAEIKCGVLFKSAKGSDNVENDSIEYARYINLTKMINSDRVCGSKMEGIWTK